MKKVMGIVLSALMVAGLFAGCGQNTTNNTSNNKSEAGQGEVSKEETDVVVIGAGGAGLAAAISTYDAGTKDLIVLEKMPMVGGNTNRATGGINAAGTKYQEENGIEDSVELFIEDTMKGGYDKNDPELVKTLAENSAGSVDWLVSLGADLSDVGVMGGHSVKRTHRPTGGAAVGAHIVQTMKAAAEERDIDLRLNTTALEILTDESGEITGVKAEDKDGKEYTIDTEAVIITGGGFAANQTKVVENKAELEGFLTTNHTGATGDGIDLATKIGAEVVDMSEIQTHPTVSPKDGTMITEAVRGNGAIIINREGKRFVNELLTRDVVSDAILSQEGGTAFLVFDQNVRESLSAIEKYVKMGLAIEAASIEELAEKMGVDAATLKTSIDTYNAGVVAKTDAEFGREDMKFELNKAPYYFVEIGPAVHHTMGGLKINTKAEVLNKEGNAIKGLFAAGEVTGGVHGGNRLGGNALADIITFGRIAGQNAATLVGPSEARENKEEDKDDSTTSSEPGKYVDGTYNGAAKGNASSIEVKVTVENGNIASIEIVSEGDTEGMADAVKDNMIPEIIEKQTTEGVDTIASATKTSQAVIDAVNEALKDAVK